MVSYSYCLDNGHWVLLTWRVQRGEMRAACTTIQSCFSLQLHQDGQQIRQLQLHPKLIRDTLLRVLVNLEIRYEYLQMIRSITFCSGKARPCWSTRNILKQKPPQLGSLPYKETNEGSAQDLVRGASNAVFMTRAVTVVYCRTVPELVTVGLFTPSNLQTWQLGSGMACALLQMEISTEQVTGMVQP